MEKHQARWLYKGTDNTIYPVFTSSYARWRSVRCSVPKTRSIAIIVPVDLPNSEVIPATEAFAVFVLCPSVVEVRIAVLVAIINVRPTMVLEVAIRTNYAILEAPLLERMFGVIVPVRW